MSQQKYMRKEYLLT